jgi:hypothetical protein
MFKKDLLMTENRLKALTLNKQEIEDRIESRKLKKLILTLIKKYNNLYEEMLVEIEKLKFKLNSFSQLYKKDKNHINSKKVINFINEKNKGIKGEITIFRNINEKTRKEVLDYKTHFNIEETENTPIKKESIDDIKIKSNIKDVKTKLNVIKKIREQCDIDEKEELKNLTILLEMEFENYNLKMENESDELVEMLSILKKIYKTDKDSNEITIYFEYKNNIMKNNIIYLNNLNKRIENNVNDYKKFFYF